MFQSQSCVNINDLLANQNQVLAWIESQEDDAHTGHTNTAFELLLNEAAQPKSVSGNACVRLCGFVEYCSKSQSERLRNWAFSHDVTQRLFTFYVEWNESDHHRSMKLVLDTIVHLRSRNPDREAVSCTDKVLLKTLISFVVGTSTKPVAKSAIKTLDHFLTKKVFSLDDLKETYISCCSSSDAEPCPESDVWRKFFSELFNWMRLHYVCQSAGKLMVFLYRNLREEIPVESWHQWLLDFLRQDASLLERVKDYIFVPLFKLDRPTALEFLRRMNNYEVVALDSNNKGFDLDVTALLQLAALESGKSVGLVEEPALDTEETQTTGDANYVVLHERILNNVLAHPSHEVRSLAFSLLITSPSTTRPYSSTALDLLKNHLATYFADPDAKFRMDVMAKARDMFKRVRGAICVLKRSIPRARAKAEKRKNAAGGVEPAQPLCYHTNLIALPEAQLVDCLNYHEAYLRWYMDFLCNELTPTASYQRHVTSLKALYFILRMEGEKSKTWETSEDQHLFFNLLDETWARALYDLMMDPFDDVRHFASANLKAILSDGRYLRFAPRSSSSETEPVHSRNELKVLYLTSSRLASDSSRADHSDGAARAGQLLYKFSSSADQLEFLSLLVAKLGDKISTAKKSLGRAVLEAPLHGDFATLRYIWQVMSDLEFEDSELTALQKLQNEMVGYCVEIWECVRDILCDDSPEGHLPSELTDFEGISTRDLLSYCFRSIHESSDFMRYVIVTIKNRSKNGHIFPSSGVFEKIGNLTFEQLSTLRHRGAFTTVSQTFATCCQQTKQHVELPGASVNLLDVWYKSAMEEIFAQVSTTRRSAGIPALITGILSANATQPSFENVMQRLIEIASMEARVRETDETSLPQVHAFNCLKDIFKNSFLTSMGNKAERFLPQCLELAANGLKSEVWAIRNCGLILLRSLIDCLFGSHESKTMIEAGWDGKATRISYHRYPTLPSVLVGLLKSGRQMMGPTTIGSAGAESVFPALDIVRRAGPPDTLRHELQVHIAAYLASPVWHVREMAARTLCSCLLHQGWLVSLGDLLKDALDDRNRNAQNHVHGVLLVLKFVFERLSDVAPERLNRNLSDLLNILREANIDSRYSHCPDIRAAHLEIINLTTTFSKLNSIPIDPVPINISSTPSPNGSALFRIQHAIYRLHLASQHPDPISQLSQILLKETIGTNTVVPVLKALPNLWKLPSSSSSSVSASALCSFYVDFCLQTDSDESRTIALENLADLLDHLLSKDALSSIQSLPLRQLWAALPLFPMSPSLSEAVLRISGCIVAILHHSNQISASGIRAWGIMMADAGLDDKGFDTRIAAAQSLHSFFTISTSITTPDHLPALLAIYDALNDDDDEVRDLASSASSHILHQTLVPIEAANRLLQWLTQNFSTCPEFSSIVAVRITGGNSTHSSHSGHGAINPESARQQLDKALTIDNSLFAVEEQNLFIDEVRETKRWLQVYSSLPCETSRTRIRDSSSAWLCNGEARLRSILDPGSSALHRSDGPLGWASNPQAFAVAYRILFTFKAMNPSPHLATSIQDLISRNSENPVSGLLTKSYLE